MLNTVRPRIVVAVSSLLIAALAATACGGDSGSEGTQPPATSTATANGGDLTRDEREWLGKAEVVAPAARSALDDIAYDRVYNDSIRTAVNAGGALVNTLGAAAPGRFAEAYADLVAADRALVDFRASGTARGSNDQAYRELLEDYQEAISAWLALVQA